MAEPGGPFTLTHQDLARIAGVSVTTIKSYRRKFPEFFFPPSQTKPLRFRPETEKLCLKIAALFAQGYSIKRSRQELSKTFPAIMITDKLPITPSPSPSQASGDQLDRVLHLLGQMNKGLGAMATAQARFGMETGKERSRLDSLINQQAALAERLDALTRSLERLLPFGSAGTDANGEVVDHSYAHHDHHTEASHGLPIDAARQPAADAPKGQASDEIPGHTPDLEGERLTGPSPDASHKDPAPPASPPSDPQALESNPATPARRVILVQGKSGTQSYEFIGSKPETPDARPMGPGMSPDAPRASEPGQAGQPLAKPDFLHLPVVLRSSRGEYLGLTGKAGRPFSLGELEDYLGQRPDLQPMQESWKGAAAQWTMNLHSPDADTGWHAFHVTRTQTPKGNQVALLTQLDLDGKPVTEAFLQAFFRQVKEALIT